jgi:hypothetical protein
MPPVVEAFFCICVIGTAGATFLQVIEIVLTPPAR